MLQEAGRYFWSSYIEYVGNANAVDTDFALEMLSKDRDKAVKLFGKIQGVTIRQLARITGISKSVIERK